MRRPNWRRHLATWAESQLGRPFAWGVTDCAAIARGGLEAMQGRPVATDVLPYTDAEGARAAWEAAGGIGGYLVAHLGASEHEGRQARPGDVLVLPTPGLETALVFVGPLVLGVDQDGEGVRWYPFAALAPRARAFRVP